MLSLRESLALIGEPKTQPFSYRSSFKRQAPASLNQALLGMRDPLVGQWAVVDKSLWSENTKLSEEAQGVTTDGAYWYVCSNNTKSVVKFDGGNRVGTIILNAAPATPHCGAPGYYDGWIYVPTQGPHGVYKFPTDLSTHQWLPATELPDNDLFPWCAIYPESGRLYTCNYDEPAVVRAYDRNTLKRCSEDDIVLGARPLHLDKVQGGVFTPYGRLILVRWSFNAIFCFSALNGHCFGARKLGDFGSSGSEVESVTYRPWNFNGVKTPVHVMELDNDWPDKDDFYLWSFSVPNPEQL